MTDCPSCDAAGTLEIVSTTLVDEYGDTGVIQTQTAYCTCCGKVSVLVEKDVNGVVIDGP